MKAMSKFAQALSALCGSKIHVQEIWSVFIAIHGFVTNVLSE